MRRKRVPSETPRCGWCGNYTEWRPLKIKDDEDTEVGGFGGVLAYHVLMCRVCKELSFSAFDTRREDFVDCWPHYIGEAPSYLPEGIRADLQEALVCFSEKAYRAAAVMCRRSLEACAEHQGAEADKSLSKKLSWLAKEGKITREQWDAADELRVIGNIAAHPLRPLAVSRQDVVDALEFAKALFDNFYSLPKRLERRKERGH